MRARTAMRAKARAEGVEYERDAGSRHPFKRITKLVNALNATEPGTARYVTASAAVREYTSRGHAKGGHVRQQLRFVDRSKYTPAECFARGCR